jgi:hypothetical protein
MLSDLKIYAGAIVCWRWNALLILAFVGNFISSHVTARLESETMRFARRRVSTFYSFPISRTSAEAWLMFGRSACQPCGSRINIEADSAKAG